MEKLLDNFTFTKNVFQTIEDFQVIRNDSTDNSSYCGQAGMAWQPLAGMTLSAERAFDVPGFAPSGWYEPQCGTGVQRTRLSPASDP